MKVILLQDIGGLGRRFEVKEVPNGHALNFLIPRKMVEPATRENLKRVEQRHQKAAAETAIADNDFAEALSRLKETEIGIEVQANEKGSLFESVKVEVIAEALKDKGLNVPVSNIVLTSPIKMTGEHEISLNSGKISGSFMLKVIPKK